MVANEAKFSGPVPCEAESADANVTVMSPSVVGMTNTDRPAFWCELVTEQTAEHDEQRSVKPCASRSTLVEPTST